MATIRARKQTDGSTRYTAIVRIRKGKTTVHQEYKTFAHRVAAVTWAKHREVVLEDPSALTRVQHGAPTLAELIRWYIDTFETISKWQRSKQAHLELLERHALGKTNALTLTSAALIDHVRSRRAKGAGPATVANDLNLDGGRASGRQERQGASCATRDRPGGTQCVRGAAPYREGAQARSAADTRRIGSVA
jgi:hypothetical protein